MGKWTILKEAVLFMYNSSFWYPFPYFGPIYSFTWLPRTGVSCTVTNPGSSKLDQVFLFPWFSLASLSQFLHVLVVIRLLIKHVSLILAGRGELPTLPCNRIDHVPSHRQSDFQSLRKRIPQSRRGKRSKNPEENSRRAEAGIGRAQGRWRREGGGGEDCIRCVSREPGPKTGLDMQEFAEQMPVQDRGEGAAEGGEGLQTRM